MPELFIKRFETMNEISQLLPRVWTSGLGAKVRAAPKGPVSIDSTSSIGREKRTGSVWMRLEHRPSRGTDSSGRIERLGHCHERHFAGEPEVTAARSQAAGSLHRAVLDIRVDGPEFRFGICIELDGRGWHGFWHLNV